MKGTLAIFSYAVVISMEGRQLTNDRFGILVDGLASKIDKIIYVCSSVPLDDNHFKRGNSVLYSYEVRASNVDYVTTESTARLRPFKKALKTLQSISVYRNVIRQCDYAYIFMPGISGFIAAVLCRFYRKPYFLYFGSDWYETAKFKADWRGAGQLLYGMYLLGIGFAERIAVSNARFVLVTGKSFLNRMKRFNDHVSETIPMITINKADEHIKNQFFVGGLLRILFVGPITERKGILYLVQALPLLAKYGVDPSMIRLQLVGSLDDHYWQQIEQAASDLKVTPLIQYIGYISDKDRLLDYYRESDIFVLPSLGEGFPRVLYEAFSQGIPVVASKIATISDTLVDTECVAFSEPGSPDSIAAAIAHVVNDADFRTSIVTKGRSFATARIGGDPVGQVLKLMATHVPEAVK